MELSRDFLKKQKDRLEKKLEGLKESAELIEEEDPYKAIDRDVGNAEEGDEALEDIGHVEAELKGENVEVATKLVDKALGKLSKNEYGKCEVCGEEIDKARLDAFPEAETCLDHAENRG